MPDSKTYATQVRQAFDAGWAGQYRGLDEAAADDAEHYGSAVQRLTGEAASPLDVLDLGCGTGRYFHRLRNVRRLVGVDLSPHMLEQARRPARADEMQVESMELVCGDASAASLTPESFDLIYSIGVFAEYSPLDAALLERTFGLLRPGGKLFVTAVDATSRVEVPETGQPPLHRRVARRLFPSVPPAVRTFINRRLSPFYLTRAELERRLRLSPFDSFEIVPYVHRSGWAGTHFDCIAVRTTGSRASR